MSIKNFEVDKSVVSVTLYVDDVYCGVLSADSYEIMEFGTKYKIRFYIDGVQTYLRRCCAFVISNPINKGYEFFIRE